MIYLLNRHVLIFQTITDASIRNISMRCLNLRQLCVSKCSELTDQTLIALANYNPLLSTLEVAGCHQVKVMCAVTATACIYYNQCTLLE